MKIITTKQACALAGISRVTLWRLDRANDFPKPVRRGTAAKGYIEQEVFNWVAARAAERVGGRAQ